MAGWWLLEAHQGKLSPIRFQEFKDISNRLKAYVLPLPMQRWIMLQIPKSEWKATLRAKWFDTSRWARKQRWGRTEMCLQQEWQVLIFTCRLGRLPCMPNTTKGLVLPGTLLIPLVVVISGACRRQGSHVHTYCIQGHPIFRTSHVWVDLKP